MTRNVLLAVLAGTAIGLMFRYISKNRNTDDFLTDAEEGATELVHRGKRAAHNVADKFDEAVEKGKTRMRGY
jgi:peptidoglycan hydrolase CwlO-like protein